MVVADDADTADELRVKVIDFGLAKSVVMTQQETIRTGLTFPAHPDLPAQSS